jgi:hypothetical protein
MADDRIMVERYEHRLIVASVTPDESTGKYTSVATISWQEGGHRGLHFLDHSSHCYDDANSAIQYALAAAKMWIEDKLK